METKNYIFEEWKHAFGFEERPYEVSNFGRVRCTNYNKTGKTRILKLKTHPYSGYVSVLFRFGKNKYPKVHRLVALAFLPNPNNYPEVNHIDEDKNNNCVWNLEWCTSKHNANWGTRNERCAKARRGKYNTKNSKRVLCVETGIIYPSASEVQRQLKISNGHISQCCNGKRERAGGYHWEYID